MSGAGAGAGDHQRGQHGNGFYQGDPTAGFNHHPFDDDVDGFFFSHNRSLLCATAGEGAGGGGDRYSSITDYLQGFLQDPVTGMDVKQGAEGSDHQLASSSVMSPSSEAIGGGEEPWQQGIAPTNNSEVVDDYEGSATVHNCKKSRDEKKGENKKARPARVAFKTKSQVDHLEDGYRWRKYGQKAVKNSSFPRSYYRCTAARCGVKKLVERSQQDPSSVITTYEGQHTHPSPLGGGRAGGCFSSPPPLHQQQLGRHLASSDELARIGMVYYAHDSPTAVAGTPPPPMQHLLRQEQEGVRDHV